jgi:nucleoside-diphosphate-sugar epimerase
MEQVVSDGNIPWDDLRGSTVLITGATGSIGSTLVRALSAVKKERVPDIRILATGRDRAKAKPLMESYGAEFIRRDICDPLPIHGKVDYIFHCAAVTRSSEMAANPVGVIETSLEGTLNILALAKEKRVKSMVYLSSMEVYGATAPDLSYVTEDALGAIDLKNPRSCYPESKRMCECLCNCSFKQYGIPVKTARLAQTFGAGSAYDDPRVFAQFARSALAGENIVLHTEGKSLGNYCDLSDAVRGLFLLLLKGENGTAYNIANPAASMTIREMAELVSEKISGGRSPVITDIPADAEKLGYAPVSTGRLCVEKLEKLGWKAYYGLEEMYRRMMAGWNNNSGQY